MRIIAICMCAVLLLAAVGTAFAEQVMVIFPASLSDKVNTIDIEFNEAWFIKDSDSYDHNLARLSLCMAAAAFRSETVSYKYSDSNIQSFFVQAGFKDYEAEQYNIIPTDETIASAIAQRPLQDGSTLIAVAISGAGYKREWMSNFAVGIDETHSGFRNAAATVFGRLMAYVEKYGIDGRIKVWTTGFSRAAATANLVAARALQSSRFEDNDVFAYTFGTPSTTKTPVAYPQIFNICNSFDPVPFVPFANWGYGKHGITYYLPAAEVDINYFTKTAAMKDKFEMITGAAYGATSNVNANWLLSKFMELLYHVLPESSFYSSEFQQTLIETYGVDGTALEKLEYLLKAVTENDVLMTAIRSKTAGVGTLAAEGFYTAYMEIAGKTRGRWADLFTGASQLIHEHEPPVYLAWLMSTDDPDVLFDHPTTYTRLILSADFKMTVEDENGEIVKGTNFSRFTLNNQVYYAIPDGNYTVHLTAEENTEGVIALRYHSIKRISEILYQTGKLHFFQDEEVTISIAEGGEYDVDLGTVDVELQNKSESGLMTIAGEMALTGSTGVAELKSLATSALVVVLPHVLSVLIILIYCVCMVLYKLLVRRKNEIVETRVVGRWILVFVAAACMTSSGRHLFFFFSELLKSAPELENHAAIRASELLGIGTLAFQMTDAILYALLAILAWRGRRRRRSRIRGRRLAGLVMFSKLLIVIGAYIANTLTNYDIGCVVFFLVCFVAFIIVKDSDYERLMINRQIEERIRMREEKRRNRKRAR